MVEFKRKHTANVHECLNEIRRIVEVLIERRDQRTDGFAATIKRAMKTKLGTNAEEVLEVLGQHDITRTLAKQVIEIAREKGAFTVFAMVDAMTRLSAKFAHVGE